MNEMVISAKQRKDRVGNFLMPASKHKIIFW